MLLFTNMIFVRCEWLPQSRLSTRHPTEADLRRDQAVRQGDPNRARPSADWVAGSRISVEPKSTKEGWPSSVNFVLDQASFDRPISRYRHKANRPHSRYTMEVTNAQASESKCLQAHS